MSATLNIVILAAGHGERFAIEGIRVPKPLIEFRGRSLLEHTVTLARTISESHGNGAIIIVTTDAVAPAAERLKGVTRVVPVSVIQPGPVASALLAMAHLPADEPVVFIDCDNFYPGASDWVSRLPVGAAFITVAEPPKGLSVRDFLNVRVTEGQVTDLEEKAGFSNCVVGTGIYGFFSAYNFRYSAIRSRLNTKLKEIPMSAVTQQVRTTDPVFAVRVPTWLPVGTPAQMMEAARHANQEPA